MKNANIVKLPITTSHKKLENIKKRNRLSFLIPKSFLYAVIMFSRFDFLLGNNEKIKRSAPLKTLCIRSLHNELFERSLSMLIRVEVNKFWKRSCNCWKEKKCWLFYCGGYFNSKWNYVLYPFSKFIRIFFLNFHLPFQLGGYFKHIECIIVACLFTKSNKLWCYFMCSICNCSNLKSSRLCSGYIKVNIVLLWITFNLCILAFLMYNTTNAWLC